MAFFAQSSAATCAAKGVDFREPLNPCAPAVDQANAFPATSVMVIIVLLNVEWTWAIPDWTFFFSFFLPFFTSYRLLYFLVAGFFLPATVFFGPLRVRAFVCVR